MFGFQRFIIKVMFILIAGGIVVCLGTVVGCNPDNGNELSLTQGALAVKNNLDSSHEDNRQDNSIALAIPDMQLGEKSGNARRDSSIALPPTDSSAEAMVKVVGARANEREKVILAQAELNEKIIRAQEEKWRLLVWVLGLGLVVIGALALLVRSPLERKHRE